jgi:endogenous inhibitor of DNA gyrase (YacG/DUF329 family)
LKKILECPECEELFETDRYQVFCSRSCAQTHLMRTIKFKGKIKFDEEILTPKYFEDYQRKANETAERNFAFWSHWNIAYEDAGVRCQCCGEHVPKSKVFQKHYCDYKCYRNHKVNKIVVLAYNDTGLGG